MTTVVGAPRPAHTSASLARRRARPVLWWAAAGAASVGFFVYLFARWITGPHFRPTPVGPTPLPTYMSWSIKAMVPAGLFCVAICLYRYVIRPLWRKERISSDGLFLLGILTVYWQDAGLNYNGYITTMNTAFPNRGSWYCYVPGWLAPNGCRMVESPVVWWPWYVWGVFFSALAFGWAVRKLVARWPGLGRLHIFLIACATFMVIDLVMEAFVFMRLGFYTYAGSQKGWTLFYGKHYQFPIYEMVIWGITWATFVSFRVFRDDKGQSMVERGIDDVRVRPRTRTWLRFLALSGGMNAAFLAYNMVFALYAGHMGTWPEDVQKRSYFTQTLCGPDTKYACPNEQLPSQRNGAAYITPDGDLIYPPDVSRPPRVVHDTD